MWLNLVKISRKQSFTNKQQAVFNHPFSEETSHIKVNHDNNSLCNGKKLCELKKGASLHMENAFDELVSFVQDSKWFSVRDKKSKTKLERSYFARWSKKQTSLLKARNDMPEILMERSKKMLIRIKSWFNDVTERKMSQKVWSLR